VEERYLSQIEQSRTSARPLPLDVIENVQEAIWSGISGSVRAVLRRLVDMALGDEEDKFNFDTGKGTRGAWCLKGPTGHPIVLDSLSPPQTLDSLAEEIIALVGRAAADEIWHRLNSTPETVRDKETGAERLQIMPNTWKRPDYWPSALRD